VFSRFANGDKCTLRNRTAFRTLSSKNSSHRTVELVNYCRNKCFTLESIFSPKYSLLSFQLFCKNRKKYSVFFSSGGAAWVVDFFCTRSFLFKCRCCVFHHHLFHQFVHKGQIFRFLPKLSYQILGQIPVHESQPLILHQKLTQFYYENLCKNLK